VFDFRQPHFGFRVVVCKKTPIHIFALGVAPVIARNDTIRIDHWKNPELKLLPQNMRQDIPGKQEIDKSVNNK